MIYTSEIVVRSYELDQYGHVNNAVYLNYLEYARHEFLYDSGFDYDAYLEAGNGLYVTHIDIRYLQPAYMNDKLNIATECISLGKVKGRVYQRILKGDTVLVEATVDFAMVNSKGRPSPIPKEILSGWEAASALSSGRTV